MTTITTAYLPALAGGGVHMATTDNVAGGGERAAAAALADQQALESDRRLRARVLSIHANIRQRLDTVVRLRGLQQRDDLYALDGGGHVLRGGGDGGAGDHANGDDPRPA